MIEDFQTFRIKTKEGIIEADVNWSKEEKIQGGKIIKFKIDGKDYHIERDELVSMLMMIGDEKTIKDLIPIKLSQVRQYETILEFQWKASRDIKKDEQITISAPHIVTLPDVEEIYAGNLNKRKKIWLPKKN